MSLAISVESVAAVLLSDGWHEIKAGSFELDSYEFGYPFNNAEMKFIHLGGQGGVCATGFQFDEADGIRFYGPLTAIQAVRMER